MGKIDLGHLWQPVNNWKLRKRLIVSFVVLVMMPILVLSIFNVVNINANMTLQMEDSFSDSIYQISARISHQFDQYNAALRYLALNRQTVAIFENMDSSYYEQYSQMTDILDPMLLMIAQLTPAFESIGVYTGNNHLAQRNESVIYMEQLMDKPWFSELSRSRLIRWFPEEDKLLGTAWMMKSTRLAPDSLVYLALDSQSAFDITLENISAYGLQVQDAARVIYSASNNVAALETDLLAGGAQVIDNVRYMVVKQVIESTGWVLCVYCPYSEFSFDVSGPLKSLFFLTMACILLLSLVGTKIADSISRRVSRLNDSISLVESGRLDQVIQTRDRDEIGELTLHFSSMVSALKRHIQINYENEMLIRDAELKALQAQINPHFLYNSLSLINWKALEREATDISEIACALSGFYRSVLNSGKSIITVRNELGNIECYVKIQACMHDDSFGVIYDIDPAIMDCCMLGIILQPIVENAIEHGIDRRREKGGGLLTITGWRSDEELCFSIADNGPGMTREQFEQSVTISSRSYGLKNVQDRLRIAYGEAYGLSLDDSAVSGTRVIVRLPGKSAENI